VNFPGLSRLSSDLGDGKQSAAAEWTVTLGNGTWSAVEGDAAPLAGPWSARDKKKRQLALSFTDDALVHLADLIVAAGGPAVAPEALVPFGMPDWEGAR
jgi:hypothetical protein